MSGESGFGRKKVIEGRIGKKKDKISVLPSINRWQTTPLQAIHTEVTCSAAFPTKGKRIRPMNLDVSLVGTPS